MKSWYKLDKIGSNRLTLTINPDKERFITISSVIDSPLPDDINLKLHEVRIQGPAPCWLYSLVCLWAKAKGANKIIIFQPPDILTTVYPTPKSCPLSEEKFVECDLINNKMLLIKILPKSNNELWNYKILGEFDLLFRSYSTIRKAVITGTGSIWMYSALTLFFKIVKKCEVYLFIPRESDKLIELNQDHSINLINMEKELQHKLFIKDGLIIGVVGDPNSGKSVFSNLLYRNMKSKQLDSWIFDCDSASPTPQWYLNYLHKKKLIDNYRNNYKIHWTNELENHISEVLTRLRKTIKYIIADLPGGKHSETESIRIPPHREVIMKNIDKFIIISKNDDEIAECWKKELRSHGLEKRVSAIITSKYPDENLFFGKTKEKDGVFYANVCGLERSVLNHSKMCKNIDNLHLKELITYLTLRNKESYCR